MNIEISNLDFLGFAIKFIGMEEDLKNHQGPDELLYQDPPERRMVKTKMTGKPKAYGFHIGMGWIGLSFLFSMLSWRSTHYFDLFAVSGSDFSSGIPTLKLLTSLFVHGDWAHLLSNSYMLLVLSIFVFGTLASSALYALLMAMGAILASMWVSVVTLSEYPSEVHLIGISGLVYLLGGFWFVNFMLIERKLSIGSRLLRAFGVGVMIFFPSTFEVTTSYMAHFYGFLIGAGLGACFFLSLKSWIRSFETFRWV